MARVASLTFVGGFEAAALRRTLPQPEGARVGVGRHQTDAPPALRLLGSPLSKFEAGRATMVGPVPMGASLAVSLRNIYETLAISAPTVVDALRGTVTKAACDARLDRWSRACIAHAQIALDVVGKSNMGDGRTFLVMSNHQSLYDVPVLFQTIGPNLRMIAKKELFGMPVFGGALEASGFVSIDRTDRHSALRSLEKASALLATGTHVWIAPEGTRSQTGALLPFKKGAFYLALEAGLAILPVTLRGTRLVLPAHGIRSNLGEAVRVTIHEPIDPRPYAARAKAGRAELMAAVRQALESAL